MTTRSAPTMPAELLNILTHVAAGTCAIALGFFLLGAAKGTARHRKWGRVFAALALVVCATAAIGNLLFRFIPVFAVLTVLVLYQLLSGWHVIYTRDKGPDKVDLLLILGAVLAAAGLLPVLVATPGGPTASSVIYSTLGGLVFLIAYDALRWFFPRRWHGALWRYEHIFKLVASMFAMLSAASGNTIKVGQPWTQLAPSVIGLACIVWFWWREYRRAGAGQRAPYGLTESAPRPVARP
jgi:uncharacterized membrane protein